MTKLDLAEAVFGVALPGGEFAALLPTRNAIATHQGKLTLPSVLHNKPIPKLMFLDISVVDGFKIAAKAHEGEGIWIYRYETWTLVPLVSHGVQGHAWDPSGNLALIQGAPNQESQGLRYYDPLAGPDSNVDILGRTPGWVTGSPTYGPTSAFAQRKGVKRLYEWTDLGGGIFVGQGEEGGCLIQHPTLGLRRLDPAPARFIRARRLGDHLAIAFSVLHKDPTQQWVGLRWCHVDEIATLPLVAPPQDPPTEDPPPEDPPKVDHMTLTQRESATIQQYAAKFGLPPFDDAQPDAEWIQKAARLWTLRLAETMKFWHPGSIWEWGTKSAGGGRPPSTDCITRKIGTLLLNYDVIVGQGTSGQHLNPTATPEDISNQEFITVAAVDHLDVQDPPKDPPTQDQETKEILRNLVSHLQRLEDELASLRLRGEELTDLTAERITVAKDQILAKPLNVTTVNCKHRVPF